MGSIRCRWLSLNAACLVIFTASGSDEAFHLRAAIGHRDNGNGINVTCATALNGSTKRITWFRTGTNNTNVEFDDTNLSRDVQVTCNQSDTQLAETLHLKLAPETSGSYTCRVEALAERPERMEDASSEESAGDQSAEVVDSLSRTITIQVVVNSFNGDSAADQLQPVNKSSGAANGPIWLVLASGTDIEARQPQGIGRHLAAVCRWRCNWWKLPKIADNAFLINTGNHTLWLVVNDKPLTTCVMISDGSAETALETIGVQRLGRSNQPPTWTVQCPVQDDRVVVYVAAACNRSLCPPRTDPAHWTNAISNGTAWQQFVLDVTMSVKQQTTAVLILVTILTAVVVALACRSSKGSRRIFRSLRPATSWKPSGRAAVGDVDGVVGGSIRSLSQVV